jgi:hypothetical protein
MSLIPIPNNSDLTTYFTTGQRKALDTLGDVIADGIINYITNNPSALPIALDDLTDVNIPSPVVGDKVRYDGTEYVGVEDSLGSLTNVSLTSPREYEVLALVGSDWVNTSPYSFLISTNSTEYDLQTGDDGCFIRFNSNSPVSVEVQNDTLWANAPNAPQIEIAQMGTGAVTVTGASGVTIRYPSAFTNVLNGQYSVGGLKRVGTNEWLLFGNLVPA